MRKIKNYKKTHKKIIDIKNIEKENIRHRREIYIIHVMRERERERESCCVQSNGPGGKPTQEWE